MLADRVEMKSGGGVLCMSALQVVAALCLLGIYEAFKVSASLAYSANRLHAGECALCPLGPGVVVAQLTFCRLQTHYLKDHIALAEKDRESSGEDSVIVVGTLCCTR